MAKHKMLMWTPTEGKLEIETEAEPMRCSKPGHRALVAIHASHGPGRAASRSP